MAIIKKEDIKKMSKKEREEKLEELKLELIKANTKKSTKGSPAKIREIRKIIARLIALK